MSNLLDFTGFGRPPTSLSYVRGSGVSAVYYSNIDDYIGVSLSTAVTSATITEVLNISGSGVITFAGLIASTATAVTAPKLKIVIDGVTVLEDLAATDLTSDSQILQIIGSLYVDKSGNEMAATEVPVTFNSSLVVSIAGDGTNGVQFAYKRYLT